MRLDKNYTAQLQNDGKNIFEAVRVGLQKNYQKILDKYGNKEELKKQVKEECEKEQCPVKQGEEVVQQ